MASEHIETRDAADEAAVARVREVLWRATSDEFDTEFDDNSAVVRVGDLKVVCRLLDARAEAK